MKLTDKEVSKYMEQRYKRIFIEPQQSSGSSTDVAPAMSSANVQGEEDAKSDNENQDERKSS
jgi:hypothetical protein